MRSTPPFSIPADRYAGSLADALAEHGDPKIAIELLTAVLNDAQYLDRRLDWLSPHLQSLIGGYNLRLGDRAQANANLREAVEAMERAQIKAPAAVLAAARAAGAARRAGRCQGPARAAHALTRASRDAPGSA